METTSLISTQYKGGKSGATAQKRLGSAALAKALFESAKTRLLNVNSWYEYAGRKGTQFQLTDQNGAALYSPARDGNLIRIKIDAPKNTDGDGFDWVIIEKTESVKDKVRDEEVFGFRVRPADNPNNASDKPAHFYTSAATSSFLVQRKGTVVRVLERGRNEVPNVHGSFLAKVRNLFTGLGAMLGLSVPAWKLWAESILKPETKN